MTNAERLCLMSAAAALIALVLLLNKAPFYDEPAYLKNVLLLNKYGWGETYLLNHEGSAGPLYSIVHYLLQPITALRTPYIRLVNVGFLLGTIWVLSRTFLKYALAKDLALLTLAVPMSYVIGGLALTEMPAIFFLSLSIYLLVAYSKQDRRSQIYKVILAALAFGLSIIGRQPFLLLIAALPILYIDKRDWTKAIYPTIVFGVFALLIPAYIFFIWNGLVAPGDAAFYDDIANQGSNFRFDFFFLCFAYYAIVFALIAPRLFVRLNRFQWYVAGLFFLCLIVLNYYFDFILFLPFNFLFTKVFSVRLAHVASLIFGAFIILSSLYLMYSLYQQLRKQLFPTMLLFYVFSITLIAISCVKITWGFSSRYPAQAIPLLVPIAAYFYKRHRYNLIRIIVAIGLGITSLLSYLLS